LTIRCETDYQMLCDKLLRTYPSNSSGSSAARSLHRVFDPLRLLANRRNTRRSRIRSPLRTALLSSRGIPLVTTSAVGPTRVPTPRLAHAQRLQPNRSPVTRCPSNQAFPLGDCLQQQLCWEPCGSHEQSKFGWGVS